MALAPIAKKVFENQKIVASIDRSRLQLPGEKTGEEKIIHIDLDVKDFGNDRTAGVQGLYVVNGEAKFTFIPRSHDKKFVSLVKKKAKGQKGLTILAENDLPDGYEITTVTVPTGGWILWRDDLFHVPNDDNTTDKPVIKAYIAYKLVNNVQTRADRISSYKTMRPPAYYPSGKRTTVFPGASNPWGYFKKLKRYSKMTMDKIKEIVNEKKGDDKLWEYYHGLYEKSWANTKLFPIEKIKRLLYQGY
jgi:hypothetical protein